MSCVIDKCSTCMLRYVCEDEAEHHCKTHNFSSYMLDRHSPNYIPKAKKVKVRKVKRRTNMYTVKDLIEALKECPEEYPVMVHTDDGFRFVVTVGIDLKENTVDLFAE